MKGIFLLFTVGFLFKRIAASDESPCEDGWIYDPDEEFGKCYYVNTTKVTQVESVRRCEEIGAYLACIATQKETEFIGQMLNELGLAEAQDNHYWIGLYRETTTGETRQDGWVWLDNTTYDWRNWFGAEPNFGERCARLLPHQDCLWGGAICDSKDDRFLFGYICEKNAHVPTTAPATVRSTSEPFQTGKPEADTPGDSKDNIYIGFGTALGCLCVIFAVVIIIVVWKLRKRQADSDGADSQNKMDVIEYENPPSIDVGTYETPLDSGRPAVVVCESIRDGAEGETTERDTHGEANKNLTQEGQDTVEYEGLRDRTTPEQTYKALNV